MEQAQLVYLGRRSFPPELPSDMLTAFFKFSADELTFINSHRYVSYRIAVGLQIGFLRATGCSLSGSAIIPESVLRYIARQLNVDRLPRITSFKTLYARRERTLADHRAQVIALMRWVALTDHHRHRIRQWIGIRLFAEPEVVPQLPPDLRILLYRHRILIASDRALRHLVAQARQHINETSYAILLDAFGESALVHWDAIMLQMPDARNTVRNRLRCIVLQPAPCPIETLADVVALLYSLDIQRTWPADLPAAAIRYHGERYARRTVAMARRIDSSLRRLETACFLRCAFCRATNYLIEQLCDWCTHTLARIGQLVDTNPPDFGIPAREFARTVMTLSADFSQPAAQVLQRLHELAHDQLERLSATRATRLRARLLAWEPRAGGILAKLVHLAFNASRAHPAIGALHELRSIYAHQSSTLPFDVPFPQPRRWKAQASSDDRRLALRAYEWATLFALCSAWKDGSIRVEHCERF
ncbi:DUF4158 domain-containing protein [Paraburkholderia graminis]|uniref:DUF4158 domain-containing protein n=1 Tax=Paraburkholderia graminis TaxID=60548 RepID=UPI0038B6FDBC